MNPKQLQAACEDFVAGWPHFCRCVNFNESNLDAEAIRFFNEVPGKIETALKAKPKNPERETKNESTHIS